MDITPRIAVQDRARIVARDDGTTSRITAAALQGPNDLAYAVRFLTDHYTYKRSKGLGEVNMAGAAEAVAAVEKALETFKVEVMGQDADAPIIPPVSPLAEGKVDNPFAYTR